MPVVDPPVDEQGEVWPPTTALVGSLLCLGANIEPFRGQVVEVGPYFPLHGLFECYVTNSFGPHPAGRPLYVYPHEVVALNEATRHYVTEVTAAAAIVYADEIYDLRDDLDRIGVSVTADAVYSWPPAERNRVRQALGKVREPGEGVDKQQVLQYLQQLMVRP